MLTVLLLICSLVTNNIETSSALEIVDINEQMTSMQGLAEKNE